MKAPFIDNSKTDDAVAESYTKTPCQFARRYEHDGVVSMDSV